MAIVSIVLAAETNACCAGCLSSLCRSPPLPHIPLQHQPRVVEVDEADLRSVPLDDLGRVLEGSPPTISCDL